MRLKLEPKPKEYQRKTLIKFAYFPQRIENTIVWLEKYECTYVYKYNYVNYYFSWLITDKKLINKQD